jgi:flagellar M-ring protein FliF
VINNLERGFMMAEIFAKYKEELSTLWKKLNKTIQLLIILLTVLMSLVFAYLIFRGSSVNYQPLYADLSTSDSAAIVERLEENGVKYKLGGQGNTILVPEDDIYRLRLNLAAAGLPDQGVVGFEIFDQSSFGTTEFERKVNYYRALGGELGRSVQSISGISYSKVQITPPQESLFLAEERSATASVLVELEPGFRMSQSQIEAVRNLVASGVQDLPLEEVTIVDTNGNLLSNNNSAAGEGVNPQNFVFRKEFEASLKNDLNSLLTRVLGPNNFVVEVYADLNFDQRQAESKTYTPIVDENGIVRSEEVSTQSQQGSSGAQGVPGTDTNIPQYQAGAEAESETYESENRITNYEINERIEQHVYAPGDVEKLSVSVMVDQTTDEERLAQIRSAVAAAIGYDQDRGDILNIAAVNFDNSLQEEAEAARESQAAAERRRMYIYGALIAFVLLISAGLIIYLVRRNGIQTQSGTNLDMSVEDNEDELESLFQPDREQRKEAHMKRELEQMIHSDPENAAKLIRSWLLDE